MKVFHQNTRGPQTKGWSQISNSRICCCLEWSGFAPESSVTVLKEDSLLSRSFHHHRSPQRNCVCADPASDGMQLQSLGTHSPEKKGLELWNLKRQTIAAFHFSEIQAAAESPLEHHLSCTDSEGERHRQTDRQNPPRPPQKESWQNFLAQTREICELPNNVKVQHCSYKLPELKK